MVCRALEVDPEVTRGRTPEQAAAPPGCCGLLEPPGCAPAAMQQCTCWLAGWLQQHCSHAPGLRSCTHSCGRSSRSSGRLLPLRAAVAAGRSHQAAGGARQRPDRVGAAAAAAGAAGCLATCQPAAACMPGCPADRGGGLASCTRTVRGCEARRLAASAAPPLALLLVRCSNFAAVELRMLRGAVANFYDMLALATRTMEMFPPRHK